MKKQLTPREFVLAATQGEWKCPVCGSTEIAWGQMTVQENSFYQSAECGDCGTEFDTIYRLVGFLSSEVEDGLPQTIKEDFPEVTSVEEPVDKVRDELHHADLIIRQLSRIIRNHMKDRTMPPLRNRERAAAMRKG